MDKKIIKMNTVSKEVDERIYSSALCFMENINTNGMTTWSQMVRFIDEIKSALSQFQDTDKGNEPTDNIKNILTDIVNEGVDVYNNALHLTMFRWVEKINVCLQLLNQKKEQDTDKDREEILAEMIEKYRHDHTMTSHRLARMCLTKDPSNPFYYKPDKDDSSNGDSNQKKEKEDVEKLAEDLMIYINDEAQRVAKTLNLDDYGKDLLHENMDMAFNEWKRKNFAGYNAGTK